MTNSFKLSLLTIGMFLVPAQSFGMAAFACKWAAQATSRYQAAQDEAAKARLQKEAILKATEALLELDRLETEAALKADADFLQEKAAQKALFEKQYPVEAEFYRKGDAPFEFDRNDFKTEFYDYNTYKSEPKTFFVGVQKYPHSGQYKIGMQRGNGNYTICGFNGYAEPITYESYEKETGWFGGSSLHTMRALIKNSSKDYAPYQKCQELAAFLEKTRAAAHLKQAKQQ